MSLRSGFGILGVQSHAHASVHAWDTRDVQKKPRLVWVKNLQGVRQIARLKQQRFYLSLSIKHKDLTRKSCVFIFYFIGSVGKILFLFTLHKGRQTSKELKRNVDDGTIVFLTSSEAVTGGVKKSVLRNLTKFAGKHPCQSFFFDKVVGLRPASLLKRDSGTGVFQWISQHF